MARGWETVLAKFDVEGAFRTVPVHPDDRWLLGMRWGGQVYVDKVLPFRLGSAPKLYNAVADALLWILGIPMVWRVSITWMISFILAILTLSSVSGL